MVFFKGSGKDTKMNYLYHPIMRFKLKKNINMFYLVKFLEADE